MDLRFEIHFSEDLVEDAEVFVEEGVVDESILLVAFGLDCEVLACLVLQEYVHEFLDSVECGLVNGV